LGLKSEPGDEALFRGVLPGIETDFGEDRLYGKGVKTRYLGAIYTAHPVKFGPKINKELIANWLLSLPLWRRERIKGRGRPSPRTYGDDV